MDIERLNHEQLDALREISNIGMGHAATALSQLVGKTVHLDVPKVNILQISQVPEVLGGPQHLVVGIYMQILGDARGNILLIFPLESAMELVENLLLKRPAHGTALNELEVSTLKEVGNILSSAFLNALGTLLKLTLIPSVPILSCDMAGAVVDYVLIELGKAGDISLMVETEFRSEEDRIKGQFYMIPGADSLEIILTSLGIAT
ncbi:MAG: chemotaxis protein CheC [Geobacter sp.]|nr:chemotaxis protein CheC [Geobacter sp.]